jgi:hypothetical protein
MRKKFKGSPSSSSKAKPNTGISTLNVLHWVSLFEQLFFLKAMGVE